MWDKNNFRKYCLKELKKLEKLKIKVYTKDKKIINKLYQIIQDNNANNIMLYLPLPLEVNLNELLSKLRKNKKKLYVPFMEGKSFRLVEYRLPLKKKKFGIYEPYDSKKYRKKEIDIAIVPILGIDSTGKRVGFGKGMYDRFFEREHCNIKKVIFVSRKLCYSQVVLTDMHDIKSDMVIVP